MYIYFLGNTLRTDKFPPYCMEMANKTAKQRFLCFQEFAKFEGFIHCLTDDTNGGQQKPGLGSARMVKSVRSPPEKT